MGGSITISPAIAHCVKPGYEAEFEAAVRGVTLAASTFPGDLGSEVLAQAIWAVP